MPVGFNTFFRRVDNLPQDLHNPGMLQYKVVETSIVTDEELEKIINEWVSRGWVLDGVQFAMRDASKRPAMAFILFTKEGNDISHAGQEG